MGRSRKGRSRGRQPRGGKAKQAKRQAQRGNFDADRIIGDCLSGNITGAGPENHMYLYDTLRGKRHPRLALDYFYEVCNVGSAIDQAPYILPEEEDEEQRPPPLDQCGGGSGDGDNDGDDGEISSTMQVSTHIQPPKKGKGKGKGKNKGKGKPRKQVRFDKDAKTGSIPSVRTSFGSATMAPGEEVPDRIAEPLREGGSQYSYPAIETVNRGTVKRMMAKSRAGKALTEEDEYCIDPSTPAQQLDVDRCLDDLFASEKHRKRDGPKAVMDAEEEEEEEETIRIVGKRDLDPHGKCLSRGYSTMRTLHPRYADWLLTDLHNLGFHQFFDWVQAMTNVLPITARPGYTLADLFWSCENMGGVPWKFSFSKATKIDTIVVPCRLYSLRVRFNTYTEREFELRIKQAAAEEELLQKKSDLSDVTGDYLTCLIHLGVPKNITDTEAEAVKSIDEAREHFDFLVIIVNAQFEMMC